MDPVICGADVRLNMLQIALAYVSLHEQEIAPALG